MLLHRLINKIFKNNQTPSPLIPLPRGARKMGEREREVQEQTELDIIIVRLTKLEADLGKAIGGYRSSLIGQNPEILPDLITGGSIEDLDRSLVTAKDLTRRIQEKLQQKTAIERVPSGAPVRTPLDTSNLSSHEKIVYGLGEK